MKLFYTANSPYARRTRLAASAARGFGVAVDDIDVAPLGLDNETLLQHGPGLKVPGLVTDSGACLCETLVITRHLNDCADGRLMPSGEAERDKAAEVEGIGSLLMDSLFTRSREKRRDPDEASPSEIEKEAGRANRCYDVLDKILTGQNTDLHLGNIAVVAALGYADGRHPDDEWRKGRDGLAAWFDGMMKHPSVADTTPNF
ncbi:MAG: glutathione S-transferase N-terminal domain-containing protein [Alphaproteobacteria bacterium]|nr:glutathione S-transferase N-terminal domain-containing protein [Alphaproteobacteria bacterium]